jgi:DNA repair ATPase RecN
MDNILKQAPDNYTIQEIESIYNKYNQDVGKTLALLWDIEEEVKDIDEKTDKWNKIRDTCDAYDTEMKKIMSKRK